MPHIDNKISQSEISFDKAVSHSQDNAFEMEDISPIVRRTEAQPGLLTVLFGGEANTVLLETDVVKYDELVDTIQLPSGKAYDAYGPDTQKDKPRQLIYEVGSFGLRSNVAPTDYAGKRIPGTSDLMDEAYLIDRMNMKMERAWMLFEELAWAQLLTADTNIIRNGPQPQYNFYTDIFGSARPAATDMDLGDSSVDHFQTFAKQKDLLETDLEKTMNTMGPTLVLCGENFFNKRLAIEKQEGLGRDIRGTLDLQSMAVPTDNFGSGSGMFQYQNFDSFDGNTYVRYSANILGTRMIGTEDAYLIPVGAENFIRKAYAPAKTRSYANTTAQARYAWSKENERNGMTMAQESNMLPMLVNPQLIRRLTTST